MNRRQLLGTAAALSAFGGVARTAAAMSGDPDGYRALVCVFLFGGLDNHDVLIPFDPTRFNQWSAIRRELNVATAGARERSNLLPLSPDTAAADGARFALPPELSTLHSLFESGEAAIAANIGPLRQPTTRTEVVGGTGALPLRLFSHNDQQSTWVSSSPEGAQFGWGGFFADALAASNRDAVFTGISSGSGDLYLTGNSARPFQIGTSGGAELSVLENLTAGQRELFEEHLQPRRVATSTLLTRDLATALSGAYSANTLYNAAFQNRQPLATEFPRTSLGRQLQAVARTIGLRSSLGISRQLFFVSTGGYDTHSRQASTLPRLLSDLDAAIAAFMASLAELGLGQQVTLFTASEFGRTLQVNGDGTDHGWGGHQFVVGGGVQGRQIFGEVPPPEFEHAQDAGGGRLIPTIAVDQLAAALGAGLGLTASELASALPNLGAVGAPLNLYG